MIGVVSLTMSFTIPIVIVVECQTIITITKQHYNNHRQNNEYQSSIISLFVINDMKQSSFSTTDLALSSPLNQQQHHKRRLQLKHQQEKEKQKQKQYKNNTNDIKVQQKNIKQQQQQSIQSL